MSNTTEPTRPAEAYWEGYAVGYAHGYRAALKTVIAHVNAHRARASQIDVAELSGVLHALMPGPTRPDWAHNLHKLDDLHAQLRDEASP